MNAAFDKKLPRDEFFDEARVRVIPRYKTSELSGDEWRVSAKVELLRKGEVVYERTYGDFRTACVALPWLEIAAREDPGFQFDQKADRLKCFQPSCPNPATTEVRLKRQFSSTGDLLDASDSYFEYRRRFCGRHSRRGDCSREDCDANYEVISGPGPESPPAAEDVSPSVFGGVIDIRGEDHG